eukprot:1965252-Prymnesium_polylepis.1
MSQAQPEPQPADLISQMQNKVNDLCRAYFTSMGQLQNVATEVPLHGVAAGAASCAPLAHELAVEVVRMHREFAEQIDELERVHHSEADQLRRLEEVHEKHAAVTARLREQTARAEETRSGLRQDLNELLRDMRAADGVDDTFDRSLS